MATLKQLKACLTTHTHNKPVFFLGVVFILLILPSPVSAGTYTDSYYYPDDWNFTLGEGNGWISYAYGSSFESGYSSSGDYSSPNCYRLIIGTSPTGYSLVAQDMNFSGITGINFYLRSLYVGRSKIEVKIDNDTISTFSAAVADQYNLVHIPVPDGYTGVHRFYIYGKADSTALNYCYIDDVYFDYDPSVLNPSVELSYDRESSGLLRIDYDRSAFDYSTYPGLMINARIREYTDLGNKTYLANYLRGSVYSFYYDASDYKADLELEYYYLGDTNYYTISTVYYNATWNGPVNPESPSVPPEPGAEDEFQDEDIPPYDVPDIPYPSNPSDDPDYNDDPGEGEGNYPMELPGNVSIDGTGLNSYYAYVDSVFAPVNNTVMGVTTFVLKPVTSLSGYVGEVNGQFQEITETAVNTGFMVEVISPITHAFPSKVQMLFTYAILLIIIRLILQG